MNELSIIFNRIGINTFEVLEAAGTKWNFLPFKPGLVGGHCIGVDPYYLTFKAEGVGYHAKVINSGRYVNDSMGFYVAKQTVKKVLATGKNIEEQKILSEHIPNAQLAIIKSNYGHDGFLVETNQLNHFFNTYFYD